MSILVPVVSKGITLSELPNKMAVYFEIGCCTQGCYGCHSPQLQGHTDSYMTLDDMCTYADDMLDKGANAIVLLGGTTNGALDIKTIINALAMLAPTGIYSGSDDDALHTWLVTNTQLTWIKTGSYIAALGGLQSPTTNQRFYERRYKVTSNLSDTRCDSYMEDITDTFLRKKEV